MQTEKAITGITQSSIVDYSFSYHFLQTFYDTFLLFLMHYKDLIPYVYIAQTSSQ